MKKKDVQRILVINPMVETTQIALFEQEDCLFEKNIPLPEALIQKELDDQLEERKQLILESVYSLGIDIASIAAVCGIGGLLRPIEGGTYLVNDKMLDDLRTAIYGAHVSNLGALLASAIASDWNKSAYIVDPVVVDEMLAIAKKTGIPSIERKSIFHALNQKSAARSLAESLDLRYEECNFVVAHLGGGVTVGAHRQGKVIDVNNGFDGDGPFSFERAGSIPNKDLVHLCFEPSATKEGVLQQIIYKSGMKEYLGIERKNDLFLLWRTDTAKVKEVFDILAYQVAKEIGKMSTVLAGDVRAIVLTGYLAEYDYLYEQILRQVSWIADVYCYPGENIMLALAQGTLRVLNGIEDVKQYQE
ncbi:butyrate kinase [Gracilibacillus alcaliphilus]|uniref:butyrate kinase n=1 Tax=Gracilibacillus alcaliphilus TaxID=1401441 RepID=UPI00195C185D|nr:butyrate kinase [Gracilibacillus alcaliphilus]MBM7675082.1 butyrate kinase [Gracilibacillus alcaliphilus]